MIIGKGRMGQLLYSMGRGDDVLLGRGDEVGRQRGSQPASQQASKQARHSRRRGDGDALLLLQIPTSLVSGSTGEVLESFPIYVAVQPWDVEPIIQVGSRTTHYTPTRHSTRSSLRASE